MSIGSTLNILSANCQGLQDFKKRRDVLNYFENECPHILCLQDTHWVRDDEIKIKKLWKGACVINGNRTNSRGVAILLNSNFEYEIKQTIKDDMGNLLILNLLTSELVFTIVNIYSPNSDTPTFLDSVKMHLENIDQDYVIICGDFNLVLDFDKDCKNYVSINNPRSRIKLKEIMQEMSLVDIYRLQNPDKIRYTWRRRHPIKQARLDYFIISNALSDMVCKSEILPSYRSDHSPIKLQLLLNEFKRGRGVWKLNTSLLKMPEYVTLVNETIESEIQRYAVPVYNISKIKDIPKSCIQFVIDDDLFLETMLMKIRGETIQFSSRLKRDRNVRENQLIKDITLLEDSESNSDASDILQAKRNELEYIRDEKMKGIAIRSRVQWLHQGEKPSKYFCSLENKNYIDKTIKKIKHENGQTITDQKSILFEVKEFYERLFMARDNTIDETTIQDTLNNLKHKPLTNLESKKLEGELTVSELSYALKCMQNNKTPGIDGFPADFFKVFWIKIKFFIARALNFCYHKGSLSTSLRTCLITCLPKGSKPRNQLKNWRPLSMLSVVYKLASASIANRLKPFLNNIISESQTGFLSGRNIGESTRLIYDVMFATEKYDIPGLLMLIDFEKAFDSVSWKFLYNVLHFYGCGQGFINWIKLFNSNIKASVIQCGTLSDSFDIKRGNRQGDPISSFLFIMCADILTLLVENNQNIKGIYINNEQFKISQFADDTTLLLDGTQASLQAALNTLEIFGSISGLLMNTSKSKVIWLGRKKYYKEKLKVSLKLDWGCTEFDLLGLKFNVQLNKMINLNYDKVIHEIEKILQIWKKRNLSPMGNIVVIKTFIISKLNHLFLSLPTPPDVYLIKLKNMLFQFLWNNKPDKISRTTAVREYYDGGMKMIHLENFITALKTTWVRRLLKSCKSPWISLFHTMIGQSRNISLFGSQWCQIQANNPQLNPFWKDVLISWVTVSKKAKPKTALDILQSPLWYNESISKETLYLPNWHSSGITFIGDLLNFDGTIMSLEDLKQKYQSNSLYAFDYLRMYTLLRQFFKEHQYVYRNSPKPFIPFHIQVLFKSFKGSHDMYKILNFNDNKIAIKEKWNNILDTDISRETWKLIFKICFKVVSDKNLIWFQYRIVHRILGTQKLRHLMNITDSSNCRLCSSKDETLEHLFIECPATIIFYNDMKLWVRSRIGLNIVIDSESFLLGYLIVDQHFIPMNTLFIIVKYYIFLCAYHKSKPNIMEFQKRFSNYYRDEELLSFLNFKTVAFTKVWQRWKPLFNS